MPVLIRLFGAARLDAGGAPRRLPAGVGEMIALLALDYGQVAERRALALRLREDSDAPLALNALRQTLSRLRQLQQSCGVTLIDVYPQHIGRSDGCAPTDLEAFLALPAVETADQLIQLLDLYRGDLLADVDATGDLKTWLLTQRARLRDRFITLASDGARRIGGAVGRAALERVRDEIGAEGAASDVAVRAIATPPDRQEKGTTLDVPRVGLMLPTGQPTEWSVRAEAFLVETTIAMQRLRLVDVIAPHSMRVVGRRPDAAARVRADYLVHAFVVGRALELSLVETASGIVLATHNVGLEDYAVDGRVTSLGAIIARRLCDAVTVRVQAHQPMTAERALYTLYLGARRRLQSLDLRQVRRARLDLRQITSEAPGFGPAWSLLAHATTQEWSLLGRLETEALQVAESYARRAAEIDPSDAQAYRELGRTARFLRGVDESLMHFSAARSLAPNDADLVADFADTSAHASDFAMARQLLDHALSLNPIAPDEYRWTDGGVRFFEADYRGALAQIAAMTDPEPAARLGAAAAAMANEPELASHYRSIVLANHPDFTVGSWMKVMPQRQRDHAELYATALRRAGFPQ